MPKQKTLIATFELDWSTLSHIIALMSKRAHERYDFDVSHPHGTPTTVQGPAQDVMLLVGEVACHGWDCLWYVKSPGEELST